MKLFKKKDKGFQVSSHFRKNVQKAILLLLNSNDLLSDELVLELFQKNGMDKADSLEILLFLPVAFVRKLLHNVKWDDSYVEVNNESTVERKFADSMPFQIIWQETEKYFKNLPIQNDYMKIVSRSVEFNLLNNSLLKNPDAKVEDMILSKIHLVR